MRTCDVASVFTLVPKFYIEDKSKLCYPTRIFATHYAFFGFCSAFLSLVPESFSTL